VAAVDPPVRSTLAGLGRDLGEYAAVITGRWPMSVVAQPARHRTAHAPCGCAPSPSGSMPY